MTGVSLQFEVVSKSHQGLGSFSPDVIWGDCRNAKTAKGTMDMPLMAGREYLSNNSENSIYWYQLVNKCIKPNLSPVTDKKHAAFASAVRSRVVSQKQQR